MSGLANPPASLVVGTSFPVTDTTTNLGTAAAVPSTTGYSLSPERTVDKGDPLIGSRAVPGLAPGASSTGSAIATVPPALPPGTYFLIACADVRRANTEGKQNQCRASTTTVRVVAFASRTASATRTATPSAAASPTASATATPTATPCPACPPTPTATASSPGGSQGVSMVNFAFSPDPITILVGTTVRWTNDATSPPPGTPHTTTSDTGVWDSGTVNPGGTFQFAFNSPGRFKYHCSFYQSLGMAGTITVVTPTAVPTVTSTPTP